MKLVMVGGHTRNIGKTSVVEGIIRGLPEFAWTAVKITQYGHGVCSVNGESCGCAVDEHTFAIDVERETTTGTDTARFLAAGASRSLWVRTKQGELFTALPALQDEIDRDPYVIVESNSLRRFLKPLLFLQVLDPTQTDFKLSSQQFFDLADAVLLVHPLEKAMGKNWGAQLLQKVPLSGEVPQKKPIFSVEAKARYMTSEVLQFVKEALGR